VILPQISLRTEMTTMHPLDGLSSVVTRSSATRGTATVGQRHVRVQSSPCFRCPCPLLRAQKRYSPELVCTVLRSIRLKRLLQMAGSPTIIAIFHIESPLVNLCDFETPRNGCEFLTCRFAIFPRPNIRYRIFYQFNQRSAAKRDEW